ncbi:NRDE protein-domain-containing protein [Mrakia frigida]|uniref:uncharacterized protein n=1 Tax=Mrakia frigida TaxID=29902 RepID=UPI003FCC0EBE
MDRRGKLGVLTNFTEPPPVPTPASTRGSLLKDFLSTSPPSDPSSYLSTLSLSASTYAGFNLLLFSLFPQPSTSEPEAWYLSNRTAAAGPTRLPPTTSDQGGGGGVGGMSNSVLLDPWEKVESCKRTLKGLLEKEGEEPGGWEEEKWLDEMEGMMSTSSPPSPSLRFPLSLTPTIPPFVFPTSPDSTAPPRWYGTRLLSLLLVTHDGEFVFVERDVWELDDETGQQPVRGRRERERRFEGTFDVEVA